MSLLNRGFFTLLTAAAVAVPAFTPRQEAPPIQADAIHSGVSPVALYAPTAIEFYLANDTVGYIHPGVNIKINSVTIPADKKPVLDFSLTDDLGVPLDRTGQTTPGTIAPGIIMGAWDPGTRYYIPYTGSAVVNGVVTHPGRDSGGVYTDIAVGHYSYKFGQAIPASHDVNKTITIGVYATRTMTGIIDKNYNAKNVFYDFRTDGAAVAAGSVWNNMAVAKSCNRCHDQLGDTFHGGGRRDVKMCVMCHSNLLGTNGQADAKVFFHKLHMGKYLPSVVAGGSYTVDGDWSTVGWPGNNNRAPYDCTTCHETSAPEKAVWYTRPSAAVCGSCHDDVNFTTGANHPAGPATDATCSSCHKPVGDMEFDASIQGAHTIPESSSQLAGLKITIVSTANMAPGKKPSVTFKVTNGDGSVVKPSTLATCSLILAGPTSDYSAYYSESAKAAPFDATTGTATYTFTNAVPADAKGTYTISADVYRTVNLKRGDGKADIAQRECAMNPIQYVAVDGKAVAARRSSVDLAKCNACHVRLGLHGGQRLVTDECVICHNPTMSDTSMRPAAQSPAESISLQRMIHRIHTGEELANDFTIYGHGNSLNNYNEVRFPGDRRDCLACHTSAAAYSIPTAGVLNTVTARDYFSPQGPGTAACLGCHDSRDAAAHAYINTAPFGEACATCHGTGHEWGVDKVHAR